MRGWRAPTSRKNAYKMRCNRSRCSIMYALSVALSVIALHLSFAVLDERRTIHLLSNLMKPFYKFKCPPFAPVSPTKKVVPMFLIGGRDNSTRQLALQSWPSESLIPVNTTSLSRDLLDPNKNVNPCTDHSFANALVAVYLKVFKDVLNHSKWTEHDTFMFVEDDVVLLEWAWLQLEVAAAMERSADFYSLYKVPNSTDCIYNHGALAFTISRAFMRTLVALDQHTRCTHPIDMIIASMGPFYVTQREIVRHIGQRLHLGPGT
jgi:hypothetical protein